MPKVDLYTNKSSLKYFIGQINETDASLVPLYIKLSEINGYIKYFDINNKYINLPLHDKELLKKHNGIWDKISRLVIFQKRDLTLNQCVMINTLKLR